LAKETLSKLREILFISYTTRGKETMSQNVTVTVYPSLLDSYPLLGIYLTAIAIIAAIIVVVTLIMPPEDLVRKIKLKVYRPIDLSMLPHVERPVSEPYKYVPSEITFQEIKKQCAKQGVFLSSYLEHRINKDNSVTIFLDGELTVNPNWLWTKKSNMQRLS
jgi:hypothetical protein